MRKNGNWIWILHLFFYFIVVILNTTLFFSSDSSVTMYHRILIAIDGGFALGYILNALAVILTVLAIVPFYCYIFKRQVLSQIFWQWFFIARLAADITGRPYEMKILKSMFYHDQRVGLNLALFIFFLFLPSYIALFSYAFKRKPVVTTTE